METKMQKLDRESLILELQKRCNESGSIRFEPDRTETELEDAVFREFGSWKRALRAAGLHPKTKLLNYWTHDEVIKRIREIHERNEPLNTLFLENNHPRLWNAARRLFDNIENAVEAAGVKYSDVKKRCSWSEDDITNRIRELYKKGEDITQISMLKSDSKLLAAGQKFYGAWSRAVEAAGIDYSQAKQRRREQKKPRLRADKKREVFLMQDGRLIRSDH